MTHYRYRYVQDNGKPALKCPDCKADWTQEGSLTVFVSVADKHSEFQTHLKKNGELVDQDKLIYNGYHAGTLCTFCNEQLTNMVEEIGDDPDALTISDTDLDIWP